MKTCSVEGCLRQVVAFDYCSAHYQRFKKVGKIDSEIPISKSNFGNRNSKWRGGKTVEKGGRVLIYSPDHPNPSKCKLYVYRYRLVMEAHLGRYLTKEEIVHHKNDDPTDDRLENLQVMTQAEHAALHFRIADWSKEHKECQACHSAERKHKGRGLCRMCFQRDKKGKL